MEETINRKKVLENYHPESIFPFSMFYLLKQHIKEAALPETSDQLMAYIREGASAIGKYVSDPKLLAEVAFAGCLSCALM